MELFLLFGTLGFLTYEGLAWAEVPRVPLAHTHDGKIAGFTFKLNRTSRRYARRLFRAGLTFVILGTILVLHQSFMPTATATISRNRIAILLGLFWGPLFGIWINAVLVHKPGDSLTRGQAVGGIGLAFLFFLGSFGNETGSLLREYARKINSLKIAGAEVSFSDKSGTTKSPGPGALPSAGSPPDSGLPSGSGLIYFAGLRDTIARDASYIELFKRVELPASGASSDEQWKKTQAELETAQKFAGQTVAAPLTCLLGWYSATGDFTVVSKHLTGFGELFGRLRTADAAEQIDAIASGLTRRSLLIGVDVTAVASGPVVRGECHDLLTTFCPDQTAPRSLLQNLQENEGKPGARKTPSDFQIPERAPLQACLQASLAALDKNPGASSAVLDSRQHAIAEGIANFIASDGIEARPYYVIGYASVLAQLGQYAAASAMFDGWLQKRSQPNQSASNWSLAEGWYDIRARSIHAAYMEEWIRRNNPPAPTAVLDEHIDNLDILRNYLRRRLLQAPYFKDLLGAASRERVSLKRPGICTPVAGSPSVATDFNLWRKLFESYITMELTRLQTILLHQNYPDAFSDAMNQDVNGLASTDLSCIPNPERGDIYYAQILEAYARRALILTKALAKDASNTDNGKEDRLKDAIKAARYGLRLLQDTEKSAPRPGRSQLSFLARIENNEVADTEEKLRATLDGLQEAQN